MRPLAELGFVDRLGERVEREVVVDQLGREGHEWSGDLLVESPDIDPGDDVELAVGRVGRRQATGSFGLAQPPQDGDLATRSDRSGIDEPTVVDGPDRDPV
ncbi:MAG: hypothetical protein AAGF02_11220 [Actinomycetota bacterium]